MKFKELKTDNELEVYRHAIHHDIDVLFPLDYLKQGRIFGYFNRKGEIVGGLALITKKPFRVLDSIPNFDGLSIDPQLKHTAEVTGLWLSAENRKTFTSVKYWLNVLFKLMTCKKKYFVYAYSSKKEHLQRIYSRARPIVLFRGETKMLPGMPSPDHESVEVVARSNFYRHFITNTDFFIQKLRKRKYNRKYSTSSKELQ